MSLETYLTQAIAQRQGPRYFASGIVPDWGILSQDPDFQNLINEFATTLLNNTSGIWELRLDYDSEASFWHIDDGMTHLGIEQYWLTTLIGETTQWVDQATADTETGYGYIVDPANIHTANLLEPVTITRTTVHRAPVYGLAPRVTLLTIPIVIPVFAWQLNEPELN